GIPKVGPNLKANPEMVELIKLAGFDVVCLANNHVLDHGEQGLCETLEICKNNNIDTVGAGLTLQEARKALYQNIKGQTVAIINFAENEFCNATLHRGGANPMDLVDNVHQIQEAREKADIVVAVVHGGHEFFSYPSPRMIKEYRFYIEQGADAVVAHHPHCIGPYEFHQGKPIVYSLGNFLFPSTTSFKGWFEGFCIFLNFEQDAQPTLEILPYRQCENGKLGLRSLDQEEKQQFERKMANLCSILKYPDALSEKWDNYIATQELSCLGHLAMLGRWPMALLRRQPWLSRFLNQKRLRILLNIIQCEAHRDVSAAVLKRKIN
ncbi:MAG: CapA family protein, partial [Bacteroidales bacterium]|nr:CapA family protein [Bacteroidales bacterium]